MANNKSTSAGQDLCDVLSLSSAQFCVTYELFRLL